MRSKAVRALAYYAEHPRLKAHFELRVGRLLTVYPAANEDLVGAVATGGCGGCDTPQAESLSANLLRIKVLSAIFRNSILSQKDNS